MDNIKIVRLQSGEDVIAEIKEDANGYFILTNPFTIFTKRNGEIKTSVFLTPWLPIDIIEENLANVFMSDILTFMEPTNELIDYYMKMILEIAFNDYQPNPSSIEDDAEADSEQDYYEDSFEEEPIVVKGTKTVH